MTAHPGDIAPRPGSTGIRSVVIPDDLWRAVQQAAREQSATREKTISASAIVRAALMLWLRDVVGTLEQFTAPDVNSGDDV